LPDALLLGKMNNGGSVRPGDDRQRGVAMMKKTDSPEDRLKAFLGGTDEDGLPCVNVLSGFLSPLGVASQQRPGS